MKESNTLNVLTDRTCSLKGRLDGLEKQVEMHLCIMKEKLAIVEKTERSQKEIETRLGIMEIYMGRLIQQFSKDNFQYSPSMCDEVKLAFIRSFQSKSFSTIIENWIVVILMTFFGFFILLFCYCIIMIIN
jgi:hypothetical protein